MTRSAPATALTGSPSVESTMPSSRARARTASLWSQPRIWRAASERRIARISDEPIWPMPITAARWNGRATVAACVCGSSLMRSAFQELGEAIDQQAHLVLLADGDVQMLRQAVGAHLARDDAVL